MKGITLEMDVHRLNIKPDAKLVKPKRRYFGEQQNEIIEKDGEKSLKIGHIERIQFPCWLDNTVLVPKLGNKWRMCIDFHDLNKACPKDHYHLPKIDQLVDSTAGCELLSMMDVSQGYHQILLHVEDKSDVSFITSSGTYCYTVMPFGLKNAGATYQKMVDHMFKTRPQLSLLIRCLNPSSTNFRWRRKHGRIIGQRRSSTALPELPLPLVVPANDSFREPKGARILRELLTSLAVTHMISEPHGSLPPTTESAFPTALTQDPPVAWSWFLVFFYSFIFIITFAL